jgi:cytochrome P450
LTDARIGGVARPAKQEVPMGTTEIRFPEIDFAADALPNLHEVLAELREKEPVSKIRFAGKSIWLVNDYETVDRFIHTDEILSAPDAYDELFTNTMGKGLPVLRGQEHLRNRALISRVFFPGKMREYAETLFAVEARALADALAGRERVDLVVDFTRPFTFRNIARLLGLPLEDVARLQDWADRIMHVFVDFDSAAAAGTEIGEYLLPLVHERRDEPRDDVISLLTQVELEGERLDDEDILGFCRNLFPAAIDTSTNSLGSLLSHVLPDCELWRELAHDSELREAAIQELLRIEPPLVMIPRRATRDIEVGGHTIRTGEDVRLCIAGAHDDEKAYDDPRRFRLDRKRSNFAFGHGEHFCLGTQMARRVIGKGVEVLASRFPEMRLWDEEPVEILGGVLRGPRSLWVTL